MIFACTFPNIKLEHVKPIEDSFQIAGNIFCVADGITRDPLTPSDFTGLSPEEFFKNYPNPSGAKIAADLFCNEFVKNLAGRLASVAVVKDAFTVANSAIGQLNKDNVPHVDYLVNDFWACVAAGGIIDNSELRWGMIGDCGIIVFNSSGKIKFHTEDGLAAFSSYRAVFPMDGNKPEMRKIVRSEFRNNPRKIVNDKCVGYGALTGEREAEYFMQFGKVGLVSGDLIVFYTDGFAPMVTQKEFFSILEEPAENIVKQKLTSYSMKLAQQDCEKFGDERTLIALRYPI